MYFHVIMPSKAHPSCDEKRLAIEDIAREFGIGVHFPKYSDATPSFDFNRALQDIQDASFVIVDLSLERPSCYYELGLAEAIGKRVYTVAEAGTPIHQTTSREAVVFYSQLEEFKGHLRTLISRNIGVANK